MRCAISFVVCVLLQCMLFAGGQIVRPGGSSDFGYGYGGVDSRGPYGGAGGNGRYYVGGVDDRGRGFGYGADAQGRAIGDPGYTGQGGYVAGQPGYTGQPGYAGYPRYPNQYGYGYYNAANTNLSSWNVLCVATLFGLLQLYWQCL